MVSKKSGHENIEITMDIYSAVMHIPLERNSQSATAERLSAPNGKFVVS